VLEAVILTAGAGLLGLVAGVGLLEAVATALPQTGSTGQASMFQNPGIGLGEALQALALLVIAGTLAGLVPAQRAVAVPPVVALRSE
jgi:putative ABC transport system permease protein